MASPNMEYNSPVYPLKVGTCLIIPNNKVPHRWGLKHTQIYTRIIFQVLDFGVPPPICSRWWVYSLHALG
jgi:hypothetical protein